MSILNALDSASASLVAEAIINSIWQGTLLAILIRLLLRLSGRSNAATRYSVWTATLLAVVCLPFLNALASRSSRAAQNVAQTSAQASADDFSYASQTTLPAEPLERAGAARAGGFRHQDGARSVTETAASVRAEAAARDASEKSAPESPLAAKAALPGPRIQLGGGRWPMLLLLLWMMGALAMLCRLLRGYLALGRLRRTSRPLAAVYQRRMAYWLKSCGIGRRVSLHGSADAASPLMLGLREIVILFPWRLTNALCEDEFDQLLLHELAHARRRDDWTNFLQKLCEALLFFHPAVWWIGRQLNTERELACDEWVVSMTGARRSYASCLAKLFELASRPASTLLAPGALKTRSHLARRIETILESQRSASAHPSLVRLVIPLLLLCALLGEFSSLAPVIALSVPPASATEATANVGPMLAARAEQADGPGLWTDAPALDRAAIEARAQSPKEFPAVALTAERSASLPLEMTEAGARFEPVKANEMLAPGFTVSPERAATQPAGPTLQTSAAMNVTQRQDVADDGGDASSRAASEFLKAVAASDSAASQRELLLAFLKRGNLSSELLAQVFVVAKRMDSDGEKAEFLIAAAASCTSAQGVANAYFNAVASIGSSGEKRRALEGVLRLKGHERSILIRALRTAAGINSDGETAELLVKAASAYAMDGEALSVFLGAVSSIDSAGERRRALTAVLRRGGVSKGTLAEVVRYARNISSDGEKAEFLVRFAPACQGDASALSAYMATAASIHSSAEQRRALEAILKKSAS